jgi:hypothetical protein
MKPTRTKDADINTEQEADEVDVSQLIRNLSLSPEQRLLEHQAALDLVIELEKAGKKLREQSQ